MAARASTKLYSAAEWNKKNLIPDGAFARGKAGSLPKGWELVCPNKAIAPKFKLDTSDGKGLAFTAQGNGRVECFGFAKLPLKFKANATYRLRVRLRFEGFEDLNRHVKIGVWGDFNDGIFSYRKDGDWAIGEGIFPAPNKPAQAALRLYYRFSPNGKVWFDHVSLQECEPVKPRLVKIAVSHGNQPMDYWARWLDIAGKKGVDIALLPEACNQKGMKKPEPIDGPTGSIMARKAKQWKMYISGSFYEKRGDLILNTAPLFDRKGKLAGTYSKNELYDPEEDDGATPGMEFPVFQTDFGKVGIIICYDSWFPETTRVLAYKGAELVLFPNAGYFVGLMPARAADNGVWMAVSSLGCPHGVWDSSGTCAGEMYPEGTQCSTSSFRSFEKDEENGMIIATADLSRKWSPHYWGGPMMSAPGGRRVRHTMANYVEDEIAREVKRWWEE